MTRVVVHRRVARYLQKLPKARRDAVKAGLADLLRGAVPPSDAKMMLGEWKGYHRLRFGDLRVLFWFDREANVVYVDHIGPRGDVYKGP